MRVRAGSYLYYSVKYVSSSDRYGTRFMNKVSNDGTNHLPHFFFLEAKLTEVVVCCLF